MPKKPVDTTKRGYNFPDVYPPSNARGDDIEHAHEYEESAQQTGNMTRADEYRTANQLGRGTGTYPAYENNPIDYTHPHNVGAYPSYDLYDSETGQKPFPSIDDLIQLRQRRQFGEPEPMVQNTRQPQGGQDAAVARVRSLIRLNNRYPAQLNQVLAEERPEPQRARSIRGLPAQLFEPGA